MNIKQATLDDLEELVTLFDGYRQFYNQPSDKKSALQFLHTRMTNGESIIFLAIDEHCNGLGFTQLYPTFSSISMCHRWILNDLFVSEHARGSGVADALMQAAEDFANQSGANGLSLSTAIDNDKAQSLYEKRYWKKVTEFYSYNKSLKK